VRASGRDVLTVDGLDKSYGTLRVLHQVSLVLRRNEKLAVIGANGLGKSTLVRILAGRLGADAGQVRWGHEVRVGYFPQDHRETLGNPDDTVLEHLWALCPGEPERFCRGLLGRVLFSDDDVHKRIGTLSGGEAARLVFARLMVERPNVLLLDEPTNHLDLESIQALTGALATYEGTVVLVSHDRSFVSALGTRILELTPEGPRHFPGSYAEYLDRCGDDHLDAGAALARAAPGPKGDAEAARSWEEQKRRRNVQKELPLRRDRVLAAIEAAEARRHAIHDEYSRDGFFQRTTPAAIAALQEEERELGARIEALMAEWEEIEAAIDEIEDR
jgi:ABC-type Mn2+/Zn2+ transport system ATPase subunit